MFRKVIVLAIGASLWAASIGCDESALSAMPGDISKMVAAARGMQSGDMDQIRQQDQLRDGTGGACPKAVTAGRGLGNQTRDQLQLRDGSGANCPNPTSP